MIRWRYKDGVEGGPLESNARLLEWEDGSLTLQVGSEQIVVQRQPLMGVAQPRRRDCRRDCRVIGRCGEPESVRDRHAAG